MLWLHLDSAELALDEIRDRDCSLFDVIADQELWPSKERILQSLSLSSSVLLDTRLRNKHLPTYEVLRDWYCLLLLFDEARVHGSLARAASLRGTYSSVLYRSIQRRFGRSWGQFARLSRAELVQLVLTVWKCYGLDAT